MRTIIACTALLFFIALSTVAQSLVDLENIALGASGIDRVEKLLYAAEVSLVQSDLERCLRLAEEADDFAKRLNKPVLRAKALNLEGKSLLNMPKRKGLFAKDRPASRFIQSNEVLKKAGATNDPLYLENLELLRVLALRADRQGEVADLDRQIQYARNGGGPDPNASVTRQEMRQELMVLSNELQKQKLAKDTTKAFAAKLLEQSHALQSQLHQKEAALNAMNEGQIKVEFMLLQQRQMLDSLLYRSRVDSLLLSNQYLALSEAKSTRNFTFAIAAFLFCLCGGALYSFLKARKNAKVLAEKNRLIDAEKRRSDALLLNILPANIAEELKAQGSTNARYFEDVSVLFADFVNFTGIAERITPQQLVTDLDACFRAFDQIIVARGLEKIKTIGDAYLCAGGLQGNNNQVLQMVHAARDMQQWLSDWNREREARGLPLYRARIGIHRGAVVAGVVGAQKFAFDIWGDTVNIAARVEQAGEAGKINLSGAAHEALQNQIACDFRGKIPVKNRGEIDMFFVRAGALN
jgi:adenylate cyclase